MSHLSNMAAFLLTCLFQYRRYITGVGKKFPVNICWSQTVVPRGTPLNNVSFKRPDMKTHQNNHQLNVNLHIEDNIDFIKEMMATSIFAEQHIIFRDKQKKNGFPELVLLSPE